MNNSVTELPKSATLAPQNSILFIMDPQAGVLPETLESNVAATDSCVAIGTLCEIDGATKLYLMDASQQAPDELLEQGNEIVFEGTLATPNGCLAVLDVNEEVILSMAVDGERSAVALWANDPNEPDQIWIVVANEVA